jgi:hypothetical protein
MAKLMESQRGIENPDHVAIVIHNYRWRQALAEGERKYDDLEKRRAVDLPLLSNGSCL